nr:MAG TPA: Replication initiation and membrane attachment [Caudoviricetes sp.]
MAKRLVDTELWNNSDIIESFTAEDKYFWLYLLTNPHNSIAGVMKSNTTLIARDMGYSKETIQNLLYRFKNVHKLIEIDNDTNELCILHWGKFNWNNSPKIMVTVENAIKSIQSVKIKELVRKQMSDLKGKF